MKIDYVAGICKPYDKSGIVIRSEEIFDVQKIVFSFLEKDLELVCLDAGRRYFFFEDERNLLEILRLMHDHPKAIKALLLKYYKDIGLMKDLLITMYSEMCSKYYIRGFQHLDKCTDYNTFPNQFDLSEEYDPIESFKVNRLIKSTEDDLYEALRFLLPQNLPEKRAEIAEQQRVSAGEEAAELARVIPETYDRATGYSRFFKTLETDGQGKLSAFYEALSQIEEQKGAVHQLHADGFISPEKATEFAQVLDGAEAKLSKRVQTALGSQRAYEFGSISDNKSKLRASIHKLGFSELLEMFHDYQKQEAAFVRRKEEAKHPLEKGSYDPYINLCRYGGILISDRMNHLNRNKAKHKHIPQELLDQAMRFYYDTDSLAVAYETQRKEKYSQEKESGDVGESRVRESLKWLDPSYVQIQPLSKDYSGNACIYLQNPDYLNVKQEYDHIVVGKTGVFLIETKNYTGKLIIDKYGNWRRILQDGREAGMKNPLEQVRKHEKVLRSFLDDSVSVTSIICIANDLAIIEGGENSPLPIIKSDLLVEFIENYAGAKPLLSSEDVQNCVKNIYEHMLKA